MLLILDEATMTTVYGCPSTGRVHFVAWEQDGVPGAPSGATDVLLAPDDPLAREHARAFPDLYDETCMRLGLPLEEFGLGDYFRDPRAIGAVASSSPHLGAAMAAMIPPGRGLVVELGPGDGALTREIVRAGVPEAALLLIELGDQFMGPLRREFPGAELVHGSATGVAAAVGRRPVRAVVSGLPLRSLPEEVTAATARGIHALLRANPGSRYIQFTYDPLRGTPELLAPYAAFRLLERKLVLRNVPPAFAECMEAT